MPALDFWYSIGSTYSYLTVMRIAEHCAAQGVDVVWRPFNVREIMIEQNNIPFAGKPVKSAYMWRDIERRAALYDLPVRVPAPYPLDHLPLANQVAVLGMAEGWGAAYTVETYRRWFQDGAPAGSEPNLSASLRAAGQDPERVIPAADSEAGVAQLAEATAAARQTGVFGAPTFVTGGELFGGDDRLDAAIAWAQHGSLRRRGR